MGGSYPTPPLTGAWRMTIVHDILTQLPGLGQPPRQCLATLCVTSLGLRGRVNCRTRSRYCDSAARTIARQFHRPAVSGAVCLAGLSSARAEDGACPTLGTGLSAGRGLPPEEGQAAGRSRALLQRLCEPCRTWPGDVHACRGRCHTPVRFDARRRADTPGRGRPTGRAGRHAGRLLHAATACAAAALAAAYPLALRSWRLGEEES